VHALRKGAGISNEASDNKRVWAWGTLRNGAGISNEARVRERMEYSSKTTRHGRRHNALRKGAGIKQRGK